MGPGAPAVFLHGGLLPGAAASCPLKIQKNQNACGRAAGAYSAKVDTGFCDLNTRKS
jgi:hypothetical protein